MNKKVDLTAFSGGEEDDGTSQSVTGDSTRESNSSDEYGTPRWLIRRLQESLSPTGSELFDLDPASGAEPLQIARDRYTKEDDGLNQPWALPSVETIYLNPPYSDPSPFLEKLTNSVDPGDPSSASLGIALTKADTSTNWFHSYLTDATVLCFLDSRLSFHSDGGQSGHASFPNVISVFGQPEKALLETLSDLGELYTRVEVETALEQQRLEDLISDGGCMTAIPVTAPSGPTISETNTAPAPQSLDFVGPHDEITMTFDTSSLGARSKNTPEKVTVTVLRDGKELEPHTGTIVIDTIGQTGEGEDVCVSIRNSAEIASQMEVSIATGSGGWELATPQTVKINDSYA